MAILTRLTMAGGARARARALRRACRARRTAARQGRGILAAADRAHARRVSRQGGDALRYRPRLRPALGRAVGDNAPLGAPARPTVGGGAAHRAQPTHSHPQENRGRRHPRQPRAVRFTRDLPELAS
eukprot:scaffold13754_cov25-Phaeocystis_antarctica.AAC.1